MLDGEDKEPITMEGNEVELKIGKKTTNIRFVLHENLNVPLECFMDVNEELEDTIDTKKLYNIMLEWNKILNEN